MRDYAKDILSPEDYKALLAARAADDEERHRRLSEASERGDVRRRQSLKLIGDGGVGWQADLDAWNASNR
jgi:hypothetical protein